MLYQKQILLVAISAILLMSFTGNVQKWHFLGQRTVNFIADRDEIKVTATEGIFSKIKLGVKKAPVEFTKVIVHFKNGTSESIALRENIRPGGETRAIDLKGNKRIITKVVFYYNSKLKSGKKGKVRLFGMR